MRGRLTIMQTNDPDKGVWAALYRMLAWLSPSFPIGSFSFSHGLEAAAENGAIRDRETLQDWIGAILKRGQRPYRCRHLGRGLSCRGGRGYCSFG